MIVAALLAATTLVPYGDGLRTTTEGGVFAGIAVAAILSLVGYIFRKNRQMYRRVATQGEDLHEIKVLLAGEAPSRLNPRPPKGLVEVVNGKGGVVDTLDQHSRTLDDIQRKLSV